MNIAMDTQQIELSLPARPEFARSVRMLAANLAVVCGMSMDETEDLRMAAEEAFVFACATRCDSCKLCFSVSDKGVSACFDLGNLICRDTTPAAETLSYANLILSAVCDEFSIDAKQASLRFSKYRSEH